jgi:hypothetical protein
MHFGASAVLRMPNIAAVSARDDAIARSVFLLKIFMDLKASIGTAKRKKS